MSQNLKVLLLIIAAFTYEKTSHQQGSLKVRLENQH